MKTVSFGENLKEKIVLCLGHFDGLHRGHVALKEQAEILAEKCNSAVAIFTFDDDFSSAIKGEKSIFTLNERLSIFEKNNIDYAIVAKGDSSFLSLDKQEFLNKLFSLYNVTALVFGEDYTFGYKGSGCAKDLIEYCLANNVNYEMVETVKYNGEKISSKVIKNLLEHGRMPEVTNLLGYDYWTEGLVIHGVNLGEKLGFPTLNTIFPDGKKLLRCGVYKTKTEIDGKIYKSITNFGSAPTFDRYNFVIETHVLNFNQNVYGKKVKVYFLDYIRGLIKFNSMEDLIIQLTEDKKVYD